MDPCINMDESYRHYVERKRNQAQTGENRLTSFPWSSKTGKIFSWQKSEQVVWGSCLERGTRGLLGLIEIFCLDLCGNYTGIYICQDLLDYTIKLDVLLWTNYTSVKGKKTPIHYMFNFLMTSFFGILRMPWPSVPWELGRPLESPFWTTHPAMQPSLPGRAVNCSALSRRTSRHYGRWALRLLCQLMQFQKRKGAATWIMALQSSLNVFCSELVDGI